jgi:SAM-dependent methyltransferase
MQQSASSTARVREHFRRKAFSFDRLYDEEHALQRLVRPGLFRRRELALEVVESYAEPRVLDVGCGSGRVGELALERGAGEYVGIDLSDSMLALARERLSRFGDRVRLVQDDFLTAPVNGGFEVVLALGFFDYQADAEPFVRRMGELCSGTVVASFPRWTWSKGPIRKVRYEWINNCPIFDYTEPQLRRLFREGGFARVGLLRGRSGFLLRADRYESSDRNGR